MLRFIFLFLIICITSSPALWGNGDRYAQNSVLAEGRWVKIKVNETGVYKLTAADVKKMGFSDISKVGVFGYGGYMLNEDFSKNDYIDDLPEVATWKGEGDFILFYAKGTVRWTYSKGTFSHERNPYSTAGYYFLRETASPLRMQVKANNTEAAARRITSFDDYILHEKELVSVFDSGRELFGESFETKRTLDTTYQIPGILNEEGKISFRFIAKPQSANGGEVKLSVNDKLLISEKKSSTNDLYTAAREYNVSGKSWSEPKSEATKISITYSGGSTDKNVRLDYYILQMKRELRPYRAVTLFRSSETGIVNSRFVIQNGKADMLVFDVTENDLAQVVETSLNGTELSFFEKGQGMREYALVQPNGTIPSPEFVGEVETQNLHSLPQTDMVIIAPKNLMPQATRLADAHRERSGLTVHVVDPQTIYNEFSSGTPDATAYRRFMKMFYDRATSEADAPKYLLLFGDGSHDNRQLTAAWRNVDMRNFLLTFQSKNSISAGSSSGTYVTDDYFGFLEDHEGGDITGASVDIGIGRFPVRTVAQAKNAVDKVIAYMDNKNYGAWKNTVTFVGDDGSQMDNPPYTITHMDQANQLADQITQSHPEIMAKKLLFDAHKKDYSNGGFATYPTIRSGLMQQLKEGTLLLNYTGHGSKDSWSDEKILLQTDINQFSYTNLPLWITATCDFTPFDNLLTSAGEDVFLNAKSGGIALYTTMRVAYSQTNFNMNKLLIKHLFTQENGVYPTLGEVLMKTKQALGSMHQKLNINLIGDPALRLNYPTAGIKLTEINGKPISDEPVTFSALQKITIKGVVLDHSGAIDTEFNGEIVPTIFDSQVEMTTLDNNGTGSKLAFTDYPNKIFVGNETVQNGAFEFSFTVPIDISYTGQAGKMSLYAVNPTTGKEAKGSFLNYRVWGTAGDIEDKEGPEIRALYLNDSTFTNGGQVNTTPLLAVRLWDETGVNITGSSIGHDITLVIDGQSARTYNLNAYYKTIPGSDGEGMLHFPIPELPAGVHTAELKVWDVLNNATDTTFSFEVVEGLKPKLYELMASPSPARETVTFYLHHNRPETTVKMTIQVYDMTGKLQWKGEGQGVSGYGTPLTMEWNLQNGSGSRLRSGIYIYRAAISTNNSKEATEAKKLIILVQ